MRPSGFLFGGLGLFFAGGAVVYWYFSHDPTGTACLVMSMLFSWIVTIYLLVTDARGGRQPSDDPDGRIGDGAGDIEFFSPHSYWPVAIAGSAALTVLGLALGIWLTIIGGGLVMLTVVGLVFQHVEGRPRQAPPHPVYRSEYQPGIDERER